MTSPIRIARLAAQDQALSARWDAFVFAHPQATFFHRSGWLRVIEGSFGHTGFFLYAERDGVIVFPNTEAAAGTEWFYFAVASDRVL